MKPPLYLIDGYALIFRAYFAHFRNPLTNSDGFNVSAIHGFARILLSIINEYKPEYLTVSLDSRTPTFRDEMFSEYKKTRAKTPEDLRTQFPIIEKFLSRFDLPTIRHNGVEADDIIATLARKCSNEERNCFIVSGDKDLYQLVNENIFMLKPSKSGGFEHLDAEGVYAEKGVHPNQIIDYLSLLGDTADNIPGVKGVGQKTAEKLLAQFETLNGIYSNIESIENATLRRKLEEGKESAYTSKELIVLKDDVDLALSIDDLSLKNLNGPQAAELAEEYQMKTLSNDLRLVVGSSPGAEHPFFGMEEIQGPEVDPGGGRFTDDSRSSGDSPNHNNNQNNSIDNLVAELSAVQQDYELVRSAAELSTWIQHCRNAGMYAFDTETDNLNPLRAGLAGFSLSYAPGKACYVPLRSPEADTSPIMSEQEALVLLAPLLEDKSIKLIGQNIKYDYKIMAHREVYMANPWFDTLIAGWLLNTNYSSYSLDALAEQYLGYSTMELTPLYEKTTGIKLTKKSDIDFGLIPLDSALFYAAEDSDITLRLQRVFEAKLSELKSKGGKPLTDLFFQLEMPLIPILAAMETEGISLQSTELHSYSKELEQELRNIEQEIYTLCGHAFNIASTKQLQTVLFEERKLKPGKKTKTGYSTDTSVLEELAREDRVPALVLRYRILAKLKSTYVDSLPTLINPNTKRLHSLFQQNGTATGRISSHDPNLQNIPIRDEEGRRIRTAFVPKAGHKFISADYSQIELVVLAHLSGDTALTQAFRNASDIHSITASLIFQADVSDITPLQRRIAKTINFGVMYGMSAFRLANELDISRSEAQHFINSYFETYSGIKIFMNSIIAGAEKQGYVETLLGRRRLIPAITSSNRHEKMAAERVAINTPIQGSAADIVKQAMIRIAEALKAGNFATKMLLQVHDELIFEAPEAEVDKVTELLASIMPRAIPLSVPLRVNIEVGNSWGEMH